MTHGDALAGKRGNGAPNGGSDPGATQGPGLPRPTPAAALEALLFAAGEPVPETALCMCLGVEPETLRSQVAELNHALSTGGRALRIREAHAGYQLVLDAQTAAWVRPHVASRQQRLSPALLETLSIVAYRQPVRGPVIDALRGVRAERALAVLEDRGLIRLTGQEGYRTTPRFLTAFGLGSLDELPAFTGDWEPVTAGGTERTASPKGSG